MDDVDDIRQALGYERINVWGGSYGTRAALVYMRRHPERVRSAILDGLAPPEIRLPLHMGTDAQHPRQTLVRLRSRRLLCGNLRRYWRQVRLAAHPLRRAGRDRLPAPAHGSNHPHSPAQLRHRIAGAGGPVRAELSSLYRSLSIGPTSDYAPQPLGDPWEDISSKMSQGMFYSVVCSEDVPYIDEATELARELFPGRSRRHDADGLCFWPRGDLPANYHEPVSTDHPTLVYPATSTPLRRRAGGRRWPSNAPHRRAGRRSARRANGCVPKLIAQFIDAASAVALDDECVVTRSPLVLYLVYGLRISADEETAP